MRRQRAHVRSPTARARRIAIGGLERWSTTKTSSSSARTVSIAAGSCGRERQQVVDEAGVGAPRAARAARRRGTASADRARPAPGGGCRPATRVQPGQRVGHVGRGEVDPADDAGDQLVLGGQREELGRLLGHGDRLDDHGRVDAPRRRATGPRRRTSGAAAPARHRRSRAGRGPPGPTGDDERRRETSDVLASILACQRSHPMIYCRPWPPNIPCFRPSSRPLETFDVRFPTSRDARRVRRDEPRPGLLRRVRRAPHRRRRRARGPRLRVHDRARQRRAGRRDPTRSSRSSSAAPVDDARRPRRVLARLVARLPAALARAGEGRHAHGDRGRRQRALGPGRQARGQAAVAAAGRDVPGGARRARRLPLPHRRADAATRRSSSCAGRAGTARRAHRPLRAGGYPAYTTTPGWLGYSDEKLVAALPRGGRRRASRRSSSRSAPTSTTTSAGCGSPARRSGRTSGSRSTPTSAGTSTRRSSWMRALAAVRPVLDRGADRARRRARPRRDPARRCTPIKVATGEHVPEPRDVQAAAAGRRDRRRADRRRAGRRRQREHRDPAAGGQVRRPGVPARRRRRAVRAGPAPGDVRLRRGLAGTTRTA